MAYNSVGTPRFYIDYISNWLNLGILGNVWARNEFGHLLQGFPAGLDASDPCTLTTVENSSTDKSVGVVFFFTKNF